MREIKFRAWDVLSDIMHNNPFNGKLGGMNDIFSNTGNWKYMQYTGMKDKNDVEIYESDVISDHVGIGVVKYSDKHAGFRVSYGDGRAKWFYDYNLKGERESIEIIGNIYQNPELLK